MNSEEVKVDEGVFGFFLCKSLADDVRNGRNAVFMLDGRGYGDRSGSLAYVHLAKGSVGQVLETVFAVVRSNINVFGIKFYELVDHGIYFPDAVALERGQYFKGKSCLLAVAYEFDYVHKSHCFSCKYS